MSYGEIYPTEAQLKRRLYELCQQLAEAEEPDEELVAEIDEIADQLDFVDAEMTMYRARRDL